MSYRSPYRTFYFEGYTFNPNDFIVEFRYSFDKKLRFVERVQFQQPTGEYNTELFQRCLDLVFMIAGTSYYKCYPTKKAAFPDRSLSRLDVELLNAVYRDGLSQFIFENAIDPDKVVHFESKTDPALPVSYSGRGAVALQSGGKDSLLLAQLMNEEGAGYTPVYMTSSDTYPHVIEKITVKAPRLIRRRIDYETLALAQQNDALNGHVPITYLTLALALADAVLHGENVVLAAIGQEGNEAHEHIGDFAINHQWSKTWAAEELLRGYVLGAMSPDLFVGSPIRGLSELRIAELFASQCWSKVGRSFSSCNVANYRQATANEKLQWCGRCPKCANTYLLFAPFIEPEELQSVFGGQDLFSVPELQQTFMGLLGVGGVMKPFECVGEVAELRQAYHMAQQRYADQLHPLPFQVPESDFDRHTLGPQQSWTRVYVPGWIFGREY